MNAEFQSKKDALRPVILQMLDDAGYYGIIYQDVVKATGIGHGSVSSVLSNLHEEKIATRLVEKRHNCGVYVLAECAAGRPEQPYRKRVTDQYCPECDHCAGYGDD